MNITMTDYLEFDTVPVEESCAQIGSENFYEDALLEAETFLEQMKRTFPKALEIGIRFKIKWNDHDFGSYPSIRVIYYPDKPEHEMVYEIEKSIPYYWDDISKSKLENKLHYKNKREQQ
jgi:hypothetical protein